MDKDTRNGSIRLLYVNGRRSLRDIASYWCLSHERVRQILIKQGVTLRSSSKRGSIGQGGLNDED